MASQTSYEPSHASPLDAEIQAWLRLLLTPGLGRGTARKLLARAGSAEGIWHLPLSAWAECATQAQIKALAELPADWSRHCDTLAQWLGAPAPFIFGSAMSLAAAIALQIFMRQKSSLYKVSARRTKGFLDYFLTYSE